MLTELVEVIKEFDLKMEQIGKVVVGKGGCAWCIWNH
jgi:hypothetical protein